MNDDLDDTIIVSRSAVRGEHAQQDLDDTIVRPRGPLAAPAPVTPAAPPPPPVSLPERVDLHSFVVGGLQYRLDVPAIIGRKPGMPRVIDGVPPRLVTVPSAAQEVSSSHLEIRQRGASVIVTDLKSTNGSSVTMPLSQPRTLRQGESLVVAPGSLIDIGDGNVIRILPSFAGTVERQS